VYALLAALLPFIKCIQEVVVCEGVQHSQLFCLNNLSCVKMAAFQFYLELGEQKSRVSGGRQSCLFYGQKFPGEEENM
jgi:hypothetical protein